MLFGSIPGRQFTAIALALMWSVGFFSASDFMGKDDERNRNKAEVASTTTAELSDIINNDAIEPAILTKTQLIKIENKEAFQSPDKIFSHFFMHIPKTAGNTAFRSLATISGFSHAEILKMNETHYQRPCYENDTPLGHFESRYTYSHKGDKCK